MSCNSSSRALTEQFYEWERRGRGWQVWNLPVEIEPPFRPFYGHFTPAKMAESADDGRSSTFLSRMFDRPRASHHEPIIEAEPVPACADVPARLVEMQVLLPPETKITKDAAG